MSGPLPSLYGGEFSEIYTRVAIIRTVDMRVIDIVMSSGSVFTDLYGEPVITVSILDGERCEIYWIYDQFGTPRFYSDGADFEDSLTTPITVFPGSIAVGNNPSIPNRGYHIQFPDGTKQDSAVYKAQTTTFTALQQFNSGICGQVYAIDPAEGTGVIVAQGVVGSATRIGAVRLGYAETSSEYNTLLHNSSGTFTIFNGFSITGSNLLNINSTRLQVNVPADGINFRSGITAPNIVYSINGCTGYIGITGTENEVTVTGPCPNIVIGLPDDVIITGSLTVNGAIYIDGGTF